MPSERGALDPYGKLRDAAEGGESPKTLGGRSLPGDEPVKRVEDSIGLGASFPSDRGRHERGGSLGDGAPGAGRCSEVHVSDAIAIHPHPHGDRIAAHRIVAGRLRVRTRQLAEVPWRL